MSQGNSGGHLVQSSSQNRVSCDEVKLGQSQVLMQGLFCFKTMITPSNFQHLPLQLVHLWLRVLTRIISIANFWVRLQNFISRSLQSKKNMYIERAMNIWLAFMGQAMRVISYERKYLEK